MPKIKRSYWTEKIDDFYVTHIRNLKPKLDIKYIEIYKDFKNLFIYSGLMNCLTLSMKLLMK
jgi:hypothetical protein